MFEKWFHRDPAQSVPDHNPANPGEGATLDVAFSDGVDSRQESVDLTRCLARSMVDHGIPVKRKKTWLIHPSSGMTIQPLLVNFQPLDDMGAQSCTTIECRHPELFPDGVFEYQHSTGDTLEESIRKGYDQWIQLDFTVLLDAFLPRPENCTALEMTFPEKDGRPERKRRVILGPVMHMGVDQAEGGEEAHSSFCPCCMFTNAIEAFQDLLESGGDFRGIRLFVMRDENGDAQADCRINGEDFAPGEAALVEYAGTWKQSGFEFRKQYAVIQSAP